MAQLYKRGGMYWCDFVDERTGRRVRKSLKTPDRSIAKERLRGQLNEAARDRADGKEAPTACALADAIAAGIALKKADTADSYSWKAKPLEAFFGADAPMSTITKARVTEYILARKKLVKPHTIAKELVVLRLAMKEAKLEPALLVPSVPPEYQPHTRWLSREQFKLLFDAAPVRRRSWLMLQVYTSANKGEVTRLAWEHVRFDANIITVPGTKRASRLRIVPMHKSLRAFLEGLDQSAPLVPPWGSVNDWLRKTCKRLGLPKTSTNDLRRTFGSWLIQDGVDVVHVARLMGNSVAMVARVYGMHSRASLQAAIDRLPEL